MSDLRTQVESERSGGDSATPATNGMRVVCVAGPSDSGKTSLVERLVGRLSAAGPVGTVKSIHHDVELDRASTDTHRHRLAGADAVVGVTPRLTVTFEPRGKADPQPPSAETWLDSGLARTSAEAREWRALEGILERFHRQGYAYVLVEGFSSAPVPTIVVGDEDRRSVGGPVLGTGRDDVDDLVRAIQTAEPIEPAGAASV